MRQAWVSDKLLWLSNSSFSILTNLHIYAMFPNYIGIVKGIALMQNQYVFFTGLTNITSMIPAFYTKLHLNFDSYPSLIPSLIMFPDGYNTVQVQLSHTAQVPRFITHSRLSLAFYDNTKTAKQLTFFVELYITIIRSICFNMSILLVFNF